MLASALYLVELPDTGHKMYIDPLNYVDTETALKEFANEIDSASLSLESHIGGGTKYASHRARTQNHQSLYF